MWICASPDGHIQATGRDTKGRKQYRYHADYREAREQSKYEHLFELAEALPTIRAKVAEHMRLRGLPREKVLATVVHLLETTLIRVGNGEYARANQSYGLKTLKRGAAFTVPHRVIGLRGQPAERRRDGELRREDDLPYPSRAAFTSAVRARSAHEGAREPARGERAHRSAAVDAWIEMYRDEIGPKRGVAVVARAWSDPAFKARLLADGSRGDRRIRLCRPCDRAFAGGGEYGELNNLVVCTLCSCYPFSLLGLSPSWYKSNEYRARAVRDPRGVLKEFGVELDDKTQVRVWDFDFGATLSRPARAAEGGRGLGRGGARQAGHAQFDDRRGARSLAQACERLMDGVHDLGGREGFGPIVDKADDKPFHADWEMRAFGMKQASASATSWTIDWFRYCRELTGPVDYLTRPYFDQWLTTLAAQLIDEGYLTLDEVKAHRLRLRAEAERPAVHAGGRARRRQKPAELCR